MPLKKICNKAGCNSLCNPCDKYCNKHKEQGQLDKQERNRYYDTYLRDKKATQFYHSKEWELLREVVKAKCNGLCTRCLDNKMLKAGVIADHKIPLKVDWSLRLVESNIDFLCLECHNTKTWEDKKKYK
ncbi:HNH endonuclease [Paenibacillus sp. 7124]|uniref:Putative HNH nuclease YajD n=2 Tax=Paenibacillus apii TaxID=1850370 RepID=A0A6M1PDE0_9BACL|nr:HNH endonuclease [Paenibacillus apii]